LGPTAASRSLGVSCFCRGQSIVELASPWPIPRPMEHSGLTSSCHRGPRATRKAPSRGFRDVDGSRRLKGGYSSRLGPLADLAESTHRTTAWLLQGHFLFGHTSCLSIREGRVGAPSARPLAPGRFADGRCQSRCPRCPRCPRRSDVAAPCRSPGSHSASSAATCSLRSRVLLYRREPGAFNAVTLRPSSSL